MFIASLLIIAKTWKQPRYPSAGEWVRKLCYIQTVEYYLPLKRIDLSSPAKTSRKLKCLLLSKRSQSEKAVHGKSPTL